MSLRVWAQYIDNMARASELLDVCVAAPCPGQSIVDVAANLDRCILAEVHAFESAARQKPRYQHDCEFCRFLGRYEMYDLYYCPQPMVGVPTVLARWSDEGPDYHSGVPTPTLRAYYPAHPTVEAWRRAVARGLITPGGE